MAATDRLGDQYIPGCERLRASYNNSTSDYYQGDVEFKIAKIEESCRDRYALVYACDDDDDDDNDDDDDEYTSFSRGNRFLYCTQYIYLAV